MGKVKIYLRLSMVVCLLSLGSCSTVNYYGNAESHYTLGTMYASKGEWDKAKLEFGKAVELSVMPGNLSPWDDKMRYEKNFFMALEKLKRQRGEVVKNCVREPVKNYERKPVRNYVREHSINLDHFVTYEDSVDENQRLDVGESVEVRLEINNSGNRDAKGVRLDITCPDPGVEVDSPHYVRDIYAYSHEDVVLKVKANNLLKSGNVRFKVVPSVAGDVGRCDELEFVLLTTPAKNPDIQIIGIRLSDSTQGVSVGNGNGLAENGETVAVEVDLVNSGVEHAENIEISLQSSQSGVVYVCDKIVLETINPGEKIKGVLAVRLADDFKSEKLELNVTAYEPEMGEKVNKEFSGKTVIRFPKLKFSALQVVAYPNADEYIKNGGKGKVTVHLRNEGEVSAQNINVSLKVRSNGAKNLSSSQKINILTPASESNKLEFPFVVPRAYTQKNVDFEMEAYAINSQVKVYRKLSIPIKNEKPEPVIICKLVDANANGLIELDEIVTGKLTVRNDGELPILNGRLEVECLHDGVDVRGKSTYDISKILPGKTAEFTAFEMHIHRNAKPGKSKLLLTLYQEDFQSMKIKHVFQIAPRQIREVY